MQLWRVFLQHDETGRESEATVEAEDYGHAARQAQRQYGPRWFAYAVKPEPGVHHQELHAWAWL